MASTFSSDLKLEIITTGEKAGQWGGITNTNLQILEQGSSGVLDVDMAGALVLHYYLQMVQRLMVKMHT